MTLTGIKRLEKMKNDKEKSFNEKLAKLGYPSAGEVLEQLESLYEEQLFKIASDDDLYEQDCVALRYAIDFIKTEVYKDDN